MLISGSWVSLKFKGNFYDRNIHALHFSDTDICHWLHLWQMVLIKGTIMTLYEMYRKNLIGLLEDTISSSDYETAYSDDQKEAFEWWLEKLKETGARTA